MYVHRYIAKVRVIPVGSDSIVIGPFNVKYPYVAVETLPSSHYDPVRGSTLMNPIMARLEYTIPQALTRFSNPSIAVSFSGKKKEHRVLKAYTRRL